MRQVADNVFSLGSRAHNFYLIVESEELTVVDAGCVREWPKLVRALRRLEIDLGRIIGFAITHVHGDHFGMAGRAREEKRRVAVHVEDEPRARGTYQGRFAAEASDLPVFRPAVLRNFLPMLASGVTSMPHVEDVETFEDGQRLDLPGYPVVVHTPGHTEGHSMFHCPDLGVLFTGDGVVTMDLLGSTTGPQMMDRVFHVDSHQALTSLDRLRDIDASLLLPGHGRPWRGTPAEAADLARSRDF